MSPYLPSPQSSQSADTVFGALRALETFSQLVTEEFTIPAVNIKDYPRYF